jgi:hypothetical protein
MMMVIFALPCVVSVVGVTAFCVKAVVCESDIRPPV